MYHPNSGTVAGCVIGGVFVGAFVLIYVGMVIQFIWEKFQMTRRLANGIGFLLDAAGVLLDAIFYIPEKAALWCGRQVYYRLMGLPKPPSIEQGFRAVAYLLAAALVSAAILAGFTILALQYGGWFGCLAMGLLAWGLYICSAYAWTHNAEWVKAHWERGRAFEWV